MKDQRKRVQGNYRFDIDSRMDSRSDDSMKEMIDGIKLYFDKALGSILLYRFERHQYVNIKTQFPEKPMSEIYGSEHLLRLFGNYLISKFSNY